MKLVFRYIIKLIKKIFVIGILLIITISIRLFFFELYYIPSSSMENTLYEGDLILVSKFHYGAIIPGFLIKEPQLRGFIQKIDSSFVKNDRLVAISEVRRQDVIVFKYGYNSIKNREIFIVKRCVGLPGDTICIKHSNLYINSMPEKKSDNIKYNYLIDIISKNKFIKYCDSLDIGDISSNNVVEIPAYQLSERQINRLLNQKIIRTASIVEENNNIYRCWPLANRRYTRDNYSSVVVPYKGEKILMTLNNIIAYWKIFKKSEGISIHNEIKDNQRILNQYCLKYNYYFVLGDNRHNSEDSRYIGPICEKDIVGKAVLVLFSWDKIKKNFRMNRFLKTIR